MPIVFYQQIEEYKAANVDPEELVRLAKDIYDRFVMRDTKGIRFFYYLGQKEKPYNNSNRNGLNLYNTSMRYLIENVSILRES